MTEDDLTLEPPGPFYGTQHDWADDVCLRCGLSRVVVWVLDDRRRPVQALKWSDADGVPIRLRPFAFMLGLTPPPVKTLEPAAVVFAGLEIGPEPPCLADEQPVEEPVEEL